MAVAWAESLAGLLLLLLGMKLLSGTMAGLARRSVPAAGGAGAPGVAGGGPGAGPPRAAAHAAAWGAMAFGAAVTALVQSSSTVTILLVGLADAGLVTFDTAACMVIGANVGTTVTAHLLAFQPGEALAWALLLGGAAWYAVLRVGELRGYRGRGGYRGRRAAAEAAPQGGPARPARPSPSVLVGLGLLLLGLDWLESGLAPLARAGAFAAWIERVAGSPLLGIAAGALLTTVVLSSGVTIGLLQTLAAGGLIPIAAALPVLFGDNIGTTTDTLLASLAAGRRGRRLALFHLLFNVATAAMLLPAVHPAAALVSRLSPLPSRQVALAHTLFNVAGALVWLPARRVLMRAAARLCR